LASNFGKAYKSSRITIDVKDKRERDVEEILEKIIEAERTGNYDFINRRLLEKRLSWYEENKGKLNLQGSDVRKAYTLVMIEYLGKVFGINPYEIPIVYEDEQKIVWRSYNWCPVLEACKRAGFDTRKVCKKGWEKSIDVLVKKINPKLRFSRNYDRIRPYAEYCEEFIELIG